MSGAVPTVEGTTRVVGILGDPVDHSLSPRMHNAAFAELGLDYVYVPLRTSAAGLREAIRAIKVLDLAGVNVTVPFKEKVTAYVDRLTDRAKAVGAVNTVYPERGSLVGENTDLDGFTAALSVKGFRPRGRRVLVIGAGGGARAVVCALIRARAAELVIANRTVSRAARLARQLGGSPGRIHTASLEILDDFDFLESVDLVVNCTSVGLTESSFLDYDIDATPEDCLHVDLAYGKRLTPFLRLAASRKRPCIDGRHMLVQQGALAFQLFTGHKAPVEAMARAVGL